MEDTQILQLYFNRSEAAIQETDRKYGGYCYKIAYGILSNREDAEESVSDAYLSAWNQIPPRSPERLATFLGKLTRNISIDRWRAGNAKKRGMGEMALSLEELGECVSGQPSLEDAVGARAVVASLNRFLAALPDREHPLMVPSTGMVNQEANLIWQCGLEWMKDGDQASNTMDLVVTVRADKANLHKPRGTANPFGEDVTFTICFANFVRQWEDPEVRKAIDERYAGQDYLISGEELEGLHQGEILAEGIWEFDVQFHGEAPEILELVSEPVPVEAIVTRKVGEDPMRYTPVAKLETIPMTSFQLNSLGAETLFQETEDILDVAIETRDDAHFEPRSVTVVMKDGKEIPLHTNLYSYILAADTPIVLSQVDHVRLHDGTVLKRPGQ